MLRDYYWWEYLVNIKFDIMICISDLIWIHNCPISGFILLQVQTMNKYPKWYYLITIFYDSWKKFELPKRMCLH